MFNIYNLVLRQTMSHDAILNICFHFIPGNVTAFAMSMNKKQSCN